MYLEGTQTPGGFTAEDAGAGEDAQGSPPPAVLLCPLTTCTLPYATCPSSEFPCGSNLLSDDENCGGCGIRCGGANPSTNSKWSCVDGTCALSCTPSYADCDGDPTNGCETRLLYDNDNCGLCGNKCPVGWTCDSDEQACVDRCAKEGKPDRCFGTCVNLQVDDDNCGTCGTKCDSTGPGLPALPPDMYYGCGNGECGVAKCAEDAARNCNGDVADGCEVRLFTNENCTACGNACAPGKLCAEVGGRYKCVCDDGMTFCGDSCRRLQDDPENCGGCRRRCPGLEAAHFAPTCTNGSCGGKCEDGFADCDDLMANGCEVDTRVDNRHCGACGNACAPTQVCFQGKCQMTPCDAGVGEPTK